MRAATEEEFRQARAGLDELREEAGRYFQEGIEAVEKKAQSTRRHMTEQEAKHVKLEEMMQHMMQQQQQQQQAFQNVFADHSNEECTTASSCTISCTCNRTIRTKGIEVSRKSCARDEASLKDVKGIAVEVTKENGTVAVR